MMVRTLSRFGLTGGRKFLVGIADPFPTPRIRDFGSLHVPFRYSFFKVLATQMQTGILPPANLRYPIRYNSNSIIIYKKILPSSPFPRKSHPTLTRRTKPHQPPSTTT